MLQLHLAELPFPHPLQNRTPDLGVASQGVGGLRRNRVTVRSEPALILGVVAILAQQVDIRDVLVAECHGFTTFEQQDTASCTTQSTRESASPGTAADNDDVVVAIVDDHGWMFGV